jgi:uncharacterized protein
MGLRDRLAAGRKRDLRIYYTGDIHGSELCFRKFLKAPEFYEADVAVIGGDITGKVMVPVVEVDDGMLHARVMGEDRVVPPEEYEALERDIRFAGFYPYRTDAAGEQRLEDDPPHREEVFTALMVEQVRRWREQADERFADAEYPAFIMPGNDDEFAIDAALDGGTVVNPDNRVVRIGPIQMLSCSWTSPTPWNSPREESEELLLARIESAAADLEEGVPTVFNLHCPPFDSTLDLAPELREDLSVVSDGGQARMIPVGSKAVRQAIEKHQPMASLHGHIHESRAISEIGRTTCVNPGSQYSEGRIDGVLVDIRGDEVVRTQLVSG